MTQWRIPSRLAQTTRGIVTIGAPPTALRLESPRRQPSFQSITPKLASAWPDFRRRAQRSSVARSSSVSANSAAWDLGGAARQRVWCPFLNPTKPPRINDSGHYKWTIGASSAVPVAAWTPGRIDRIRRWRRACAGQIGQQRAGRSARGPDFTASRLATAIVDRLTFNALIIETGPQCDRLRASRSARRGRLPSTLSLIWPAPVGNEVLSCLPRVLLHDQQVGPPPIDI